MLATDHICILTTTGRVCCWGFNKHGECGVGSTLPWIRTPTWLNLNFPVVDIAIGYNHTVLLTGKAYDFSYVLKLNRNGIGLWMWK